MLIFQGVILRGSVLYPLHPFDWMIGVEFLFQESMRATWVRIGWIHLSRAMKKGPLVVCWVFVGDEILPSYVGIIS